MKIIIKLLLVAVVILVTGCVERRMLIISDPPQATVILDGAYVGKTPLKIDFDFYGTREIVLHKKGYHVLAAEEEISPPYYQVFPLDFIAEFLWPATIEDSHGFNYTMQPHLPIDDKERQQMLDNAEKLRQRVPTE